MVRKDVRIGAVVLAILLAVIVVYVLVVPSGKPVAQQPVANADEAFKEQMKQAESRTPSRPAGDVAAPAGPTVATNTTPAGTDPFADTGEKWMMALNTGAVPQARVKPDATLSNRRETVAPAGDRKPAPDTAAGNLPISIDPAQSVKPTVKTHTVKAGDSIARIAEAVYGSQVYYKEILAANPSVDPKKLKPGTVLKIPDVKEVKGKGGAEDDTPAPQLEKSEYRVASGDSMHSIAKKLYGKSDMWEQIYDLNKGKIGNDPAKLKVGMILKLPSAPTQN